MSDQKPTIVVVYSASQDPEECAGRGAYGVESQEFFHSDVETGLRTLAEARLDLEFVVEMLGKIRSFPFPSEELFGVQNVNIADSEFSLSDLGNYEPGTVFVTVLDLVQVIRPFISIDPSFIVYYNLNDDDVAENWEHLRVHD